MTTTLRTAHPDPPATDGVHVDLTATQLAELELLLAGDLRPVHGYLEAEDHCAVADRGRLADGTPFPLPLSLPVPDDIAASLRAGERVGLRDPQGVLVGVVTVSDVFFHRDWARIGGPVRPAAPIEHADFPELRTTPSQHRDDGRKAGHGRLLAVPVRGELTDADARDLDTLAGELGAGLLLTIVDHPDPGHPGRFPRIARLQRLAADLTAPTRVRLRPATSVDALPCADLDVLIAGNDGATHVTVATPPRQVPAGIVPVRWTPAGTTDGVTGSDPHRDTASVRPDERGLVVFFTGLSGSGKSTLAAALTARLRAAGRTVTLLDGDVVRKELSSGLGFSPEDRATNVRRIGWVAAEVARHGGTAVCAPIAPDDTVRRQVRAMVEQVGARFVLVHVATPLEACEARDRKGLYAQARAGRLTGFTGIDAPYEPPADAEVVVDTSGLPVDDALRPVMTALGV